VDYLLTDKASKFAVVIVIRKEIKIRKVKPNIRGNNSSCNLNLKRYREGVKNLKIKLVNGKEEEISKRNFIEKETIFTSSKYNTRNKPRNYSLYNNKYRNYH